MADNDFPRDVWIDIETGEWGLRSNLRFIRQTELPLNLSDVTEAELRCVGIDNGVPIQYI
jgi:hypothetical protein